MRIFLLALAILLEISTRAKAWLVTAPAAGSVQVLSKTSSTLSGSGGRFFAIGFGNTGGQTSDFAAFVAPVAGTLGNMRAFAQVAPTGAQTFVITLNKNGSGTSVTCTINSTTNPCTFAGTVSISPGDYLDFHSAPSGTPTGSRISVALDFTPTTANDTILTSYPTVAFSTSTAQSINLFSGTSPGSAVNRNKSIFPENGAIDKLYGIASAAPGGSASYALDVLKNAAGGPTFTCSVSGAGTTCNDTTSTLSIVAGNNAQFQATPASTPTAASIGFGARFVPATAKDFFFFGNQGEFSDSSIGSTTYFAPTAADADGGVTEASVQAIENHMTITGINVTTSSPVGTGITRTYTLRDNGADTSLHCAVSGNSVATCSATGSVSIADGDFIDVDDVPSASASSVQPFVVLTAHR